MRHPVAAKDIHFQYYVLIHKVSKDRLVGCDSAHFDSSEKHVFRFLCHARSSPIPYGYRAGYSYILDVPVHG